MHVISLFNSLRDDETICRQWFSTSALVEIINAVFQLETEYIVLESQQFKQSMSLPNLGGMFVESLQMCTEGMVCRTSINYHNGNKEYGYCFPSPPKERHHRSQRSNAKKHGKDSRHRGRDVTQAIPMIPSVEQMNNPQILLEVKRKNSVVQKLLLNVLGDKLRTNISSPIKKKKKLPKFVSPSASDVTPTSQNKSPVQAVQNQVQRCIAETLNLELVSIWNSKTARNLFGMKLGDDVKEKVKQIGTALKYAVNNFECLMQLMPGGCTESEVRDQIGEHELEHLKKKCHYLGTAWNLAIKKKWLDSTPRV